MNIAIEPDLTDQCCIAIHWSDIINSLTEQVKSKFSPRCWYRGTDDKFFYFKCPEWPGLPAFELQFDKMIVVDEIKRHIMDHPLVKSLYELADEIECNELYVLIQLHRLG